MCPLSSGLCDLLAGLFIFRGVGFGVSEPSSMHVAFFCQIPNVITFSD